jgi:hypothetical protein
VHKHHQLIEEVLIDRDSQLYEKPSSTGNLRRDGIILSDIDIISLELLVFG